MTLAEPTWRSRHQPRAGDRCYYVLGRKPNGKVVKLRRLRGLDHACDVALSLDMAGWDDIWVDEIDRSDAQPSLHEQVRRVIELVDPRHPDPAPLVLQAVCLVFDVSSDEVRGTSQAECFAVPRQIGMAVAAIVCKARPIDIARAFNRDQSTTHYSLHKHRALIEQVLAETLSYSEAAE